MNDQPETPAADLSPAEVDTLLRIEQTPAVTAETEGIARSRRRLDLDAVALAAAAAPLYDLLDWHWEDGTPNGREKVTEARLAVALHKMLTTVLDGLNSGDIGPEGGYSTGGLSLYVEEHGTEDEAVFVSFTCDLGSIRTMDPKSRPRVRFQA